MGVKICVNGKFIELSEEEFIKNIPEEMPPTIEEKVAQLEEYIEKLKPIIDRISTFLGGVK